MVQSEDRARKLRADLAVEEHRGKELNRILQEILPDPNTSNPQKSRMGRKVGCSHFSTCRFCCVLKLFKNQSRI